MADDASIQASVAPTSTAGVLFQAGLAAATALAQDAEIFASAFGAGKAAQQISTGLGATAAVAPSLVGVAELMSAIGTLFRAAGHAHAAAAAGTNAGG